MATTYTYEIEEMEGREGVRMAWKSLKDTAHKYSNRRVRTQIDNGQWDSVLEWKLAGISV